MSARPRYGTDALLSDWSEEPHPEKKIKEIIGSLFSRDLLHLPDRELSSKRTTLIMVCCLK